VFPFPQTFPLVLSTVNIFVGAHICEKASFTFVMSACISAGLTERILVKFNTGGGGGRYENLSGKSEFV